MAEMLPSQEVMAPRFPPENDLWPGRWRTARWLVMAAVLLPWLILGLIGLDLGLRGQRPERAAAHWMAVLGLSTPTLWPAGNDMHYPSEIAP